MDRMGLAEFLTPIFRPMATGKASLGQVATIWLSSILSQGDHRLVHVEPWVAGRQITLSQVTGKWCGLMNLAMIGLKLSCVS